MPLTCVRGVTRANTAEICHWVEAFGDSTATSVGEVTRSGPGGDGPERVR